jgi:ribosome biogenesis GTPase
VEVTDLGGGEGIIDRVLPRATLLRRPPVANADTVVAVVSWERPPFSAAFVDRMVLAAALEGCGAVVCLNKCDLLSPEAARAAAEALRPFSAAGYPTLQVSAARGDGVEGLRALLRGHLAVLAGPSGSGKSSLLSALVPARARRAGALSRRSGRGRHTTRSVELLPLPGGGQGFVADTPGFSRLTLDAADPEDLPLLYPDFSPHAAACRFRGCLHDAEPECGVRAAVAAGAVDAGRYERYRALLAELRARPPRW